MKNYCFNKKESSNFIKYYIDGGVGRNIVYYGDGTSKITVLSKNDLNEIMEKQINTNEFNVLGDNKNSFYNKFFKKVLLLFVLVISLIATAIYTNSILIFSIFGVIGSIISISMFHDLSIIKDYQKNKFFIDNKSIFNKMDKSLLKEKALIKTDEININNINDIKKSDLIKLREFMINLENPQKNSNKVYIKKRF